MTDRDRKPPSPPDDFRQQAYAALEELLSRADLHKATGAGHLLISLNQGHPTAIRISLEEAFKPNR